MRDELPIEPCPICGELTNSILCENCGLAYLDYIERNPIQWTPEQLERMSKIKTGKNLNNSRGHASAELEVILKRVDIECVYCEWRSVEDIPFVNDDSVHWITCPECGRAQLMDLAVIEYLDE